MKTKQLSISTVVRNDSCVMMRGGGRSFVDFIAPVNPNLVAFVRQMKREDRRRNLLLLVKFQADSGTANFNFNSWL